MTIKTIFPDFVYHGTSLKVARLFAKPIDESVLARFSINKDFGAGLYTTIDIRQSQDWAERCLEDVEFRRQKFLNAGNSELVYEDLFRDTIKDDEANIPAVIRFRFDDYFDLDFCQLHYYLGESNAWARFVLEHRLYSRYEDCSCIKKYGSHPEIVIGLLADNKIREVMDEYETLFGDKVSDESVIWFRNKIVRRKDGEQLQGLGLGNQISFHHPSLNDFVKIGGLIVGELCYNVGKGITVNWNQSDFIKWGE